MKNIIKGIICAALVGVTAIAAVGCSAEVTVPDWVAQLSCSHENWDDGEVTKDATCTEEGEIVYTCEDCGKTKKEVLEVAEHDAVLLYKKLSTCNAEGEEVYECKDCDKLWRETLEKAEHTFGDDQTCDYCEYTYYVATVTCGAETVAEIKYDETSVAAALKSLKAIEGEQDDGYSYEFISELPEELALDNCSFTVEKTAIEYKGKLFYNVTGEPMSQEFVFTVEDAAEKYNAIKDLGESINNEYAEEGYEYKWIDKAGNELGEALSLKDCEFTLTKVAIKAD